MATKQELEAGGRGWLAGRWAQVPPAGRAEGWTDTRRWVELFVPEFADGQSPGIHNEAVRFMEVATAGTELDITRDWRLKTLCVEGASDALVLLANQWLLLDSGGGSAVPDGWKPFGASLRPVWWDYRRHEQRGTDRLVGQAREPQWAAASIAAVPGNDSALEWLKSDGGAPVNETAWLNDCRNFVLHPEQYAALRSHLGLPVEEPPPPVEPPVDPPTDPDPPSDPPPPSGTLREKLENARLLAMDARKRADQAVDAASSAALAAGGAVALIDDALAELEGGGE